MDNYFRTRWKEIVAAALMLAGLILAFFFVWTGGFLVGCGFGLYFDRSIVTYLVSLKNSLTQTSLLTNLMLLGALLYLLITVTTFVIGIAIGVLIMLLIRYSNRPLP